MGAAGTTDKAGDPEYVRNRFVGDNLLPLNSVDSTRVPVGRPLE